MGGLFSEGLTKDNSAMTMPGGGNVYYPDAAHAGVALARESAKTAMPSNIVTNAGTDESGAPVATGVSNIVPTVDSQPSLRRPGFREVAFDKSTGNVNPVGKSTTKLGSLMQVLLGGAQGGVDAIQNGALDAPRNGESNITKGLSGAIQMPQVRRQQALQNRVQEAQAAQIPIQQQTAQVNLDNARAETAKTQAQTKLYQTQADAKTADPNDKVIHAYVGGDGKQHLVMQKADNSTYDKALGDVNQKDATTLDAAALEQMRVANGGNPPTLKQLSDYQRSKAQATHITVAPAAAVMPEIKPNTPQFKIAQDLAYGKLTTQQFRSLTAYSRDTGLKMAIYDKAGQLNPQFNPAQFEMGFKLASNPKVQQQLASLDNVVQGLPDLINASDAAARSGIKQVNKIVNWTGASIGNKKYSNFHTAQTAFADELSGALGYGSATDMSREMGFNMTDPNLGPEQFASAMQEVVLPFINRKRGTLLNQMGVYGQPNMNPAASAPTTTDGTTAPDAGGWQKDKNGIRIRVLPN
jgi:hypothetical protein